MRCFRLLSGRYGGEWEACNLHGEEGIGSRNGRSAAGTTAVAAEEAAETAAVAAEEGAVSTGVSVTAGTAAVAAGERYGDGDRRGDARKGRDIMVEKGWSYKRVGIFLTAQRVLLSEQGLLHALVPAYLTVVWRKQCHGQGLETWEEDFEKNEGEGGQDVQ